jgi:hypothetical protein
MEDRDSGIKTGIRMAASVASEYDGLSLHPNLVSDCILWKLNLFKKKPRRNEVHYNMKKTLHRISSVLERLVNEYNARGSFIACITPKCRKDAAKGDRVWAMWNDAVKLLDEIFPAVATKQTRNPRKKKVVVDRYEDNG